MAASARRASARRPGGAGVHSRCPGSVLRSAGRVGCGSGVAERSERNGGRTSGMAFTTPTTVADSHTAAAAPPAYSAMLLLFSVCSHCGAASGEQKLSDRPGPAPYRRLAPPATRRPAAAADAAAAVAACRGANLLLERLNHLLGIERLLGLGSKRHHLDPRASAGGPGAQPGKWHAPGGSGPRGERAARRRRTTRRERQPARSASCAPAQAPRRAAASRRRP